MPTPTSFLNFNFLKLAIVLYSRDCKGVGMIHEYKHNPKSSCTFPRWYWGSIAWAKLILNKLSDQPKMLSRSYYVNYLTTNWLSTWVSDAFWVQTSITWQPLRLQAWLFLLFDFASTREVSFGMLQWDLPVVAHSSLLTQL